MMLKSGDNKVNTQIVINALTIDVEDWYHTYFTSNERPNKWPMYENRIVKYLQMLLEILDEHKTKATFFVVGYIAERFPQLVKEIHHYGHEIATHGYDHQPVDRRGSKEEFVQDLKKSIDILENIIQTKILGFRACNFSITKETLWVLKMIKEAGLIYDSSIFPIDNFIHRTYNAKFPRFSYKIEDIIEVPLSTVKILGMNLPIAGGFYFRLLPYNIIRWGIRRINAENQPAVVYIHPAEFDKDIPQIDVPFWDRFAGSYNNNKTEERFKRLLSDFRFSSIRDVFSLS